MTRGSCNTGLALWYAHNLHPLQGVRTPPTYELAKVSALPASIEAVARILCSLGIGQHPPLFFSQEAGKVLAAVTNRFLTFFVPLRTPPPPTRNVLDFLLTFD